jgi:hypothetical protein
LPRVPRRYTKPNELCSFCNAPVFFRQLRNLGRVYFDEPGAPWRKHPCTDKTSLFYRGPFGSGNEGWPQLTQISVDALSNDVLRLSGKLNNQDCVVFVGGRAFRGTPNSSRYLSESFIQAHSSLDGRFDLALLTPDLKHMLLTGYLAAADAASEQA